MGTADRFAYASARLHSIENRMPDKEALFRMSEAVTTDDVLKALAEYGYDTSGNGQMFDAEMKKTFSLIEKIAPAKEQLMIFYLKSDYHNLKVLIKSERLFTENDHLLYDNGYYASHELSQIIRDRKHEKLSKHMAEALHRISEEFAKTGDPQLIDIILDEAYFAQCFDIARELDNSFLKKNLQLTVDTRNIITFFRIKRLKLGAGFLKKVLIDEGEIPEKAFIAAYDKSSDDAVSEFRISRYEELIKLGYELLESADTLMRLEKLADEIHISFMKKYRYVPFGIEPVIAHITAKEYEIKNIRMILSGITNGLVPDTIKERLRMSYA